MSADCEVGMQTSVGESMEKMGNTIASTADSFEELVGRLGHVSVSTPLPKEAEATPDKPRCKFDQRLNEFIERIGHVNERIRETITDLQI